jgi:two-component system sensor histidine kinase YesM
MRLATTTLIISPTVLEIFGNVPLGVPQILKKSQSTKLRLILPTTLSFVVFMVAMFVSAYQLYSSYVTTSTRDQTLATSQQVLNSYENYFDQVLGVSNNISSKYDAENVADIQKDMQSYFDVVKSLRSEILEVSIYRASDGVYLSSDSSSTVQNASLEDEWFSSANKNTLINVFSRISSNAYPDVQYSFTLSKYIPFDKNNNYNAVLKVDFDFTKIVETITNATLGTEGRFIIYDKNYGIVYSSESNNSKQAMGLVKKLVIGSQSVEFDGHSFFLYAATISNTTWRVAIFTNEDALATAISRFALYVAIIGLALIALFIGVVLMVANSITNPIRHLQKEMADIESLNYGASLEADIKGTSEVVELNKSFVQMMGRIQELTQAIVDEKERQRQSELKALQNQINPHFLYNTLDSIIAMIDKGENEKAEKMIVALSKFFRISISKGQNVIPLPNEIEHARNYLLIQKMRFGDAFNYDIEMEPGLEQYYVVKLILQPIVENSIGHGLKEGEEGHILIKAYTEGDLIKFDIQDNGYGMLPSKVEELEASFKNDDIHQGVGLKNVYQRIRIYYGEKANIEIHSEEDIGTKVTIVLPKEGALKHE